MRVLIAGDFCPINRAEELLASGSSVIDGDLGTFIKEHDAFIGNLECPITENKKAYSKIGPSLKVSPEIMSGMKNLGFTCFSLANNHIMDYGPEGLNETILNLNSIGVDSFGCKIHGKGSPFKLIESKYCKIGILAFSNHEFSSISDFDDSGTWPVDAVDMYNRIQVHKKECDYLIMLLHVGLGGLPIPYPGLRNLCRFLIDIGSFSVLCQHSHICGAYEYYNEGFISYGQGSLVFDVNKPGTYWENGYLLSFNFSTEEPKIDIKGIKQFGIEPISRLMTIEEEKLLATYLDDYNSVLENENNYATEWSTYLNRVERDYYGYALLPQGKWFRRITRRVDLQKLLPNSMKLVWLNYLRNEEHRQVMIALMKRSKNG